MSVRNEVTVPLPDALPGSTVKPASGSVPAAPWSPVTEA